MELPFFTYSILEKWWWAWWWYWVSGREMMKKDEEKSKKFFPQLFSWPLTKLLSTYMTLVQNHIPRLLYMWFYVCGEGKTKIAPLSGACATIHIRIHIEYEILSSLSNIYSLLCVCDLIRLTQYIFKGLACFQQVLYWYCHRNAAIPSSHPIHII